MEGKHKELDQSDTLDLDKSSKKHRVRTAGKRLSGRPSIERLGSSSKASLVGNPSVSSLLTEDSDLSNASPKERQHHHEKLMKQVSAWLKHEKARRAARKAKRKTATEDTPRDIERSEHALTDQAAKSDTDQTRRGSESSEGSVALEQLANILERTLSLKSNEGSPKKRRSSHAHKLSGIMKRHHSTVSSDTDYFESADDFVPSAEAVLDNSKTLAYGGGGPEMVADSGASIKSNRSRRTKQKKEAWATFKYEIVRITHTLKLKGWRRVPLELSGQIDVKRLSGAMTNAVYVVSPPADLHTQKEKESGPPAPRNPPP
jgi:choline kinase